ncbi:MAG: polysaccharide export protein [Verrucomicrobiota bacterium]|nr:polysaccharide export protein [Verrucomicrobiota bacterium]
MRGNAPQTCFRGLGSFRLFPVWAGLKPFRWMFGWGVCLTVWLAGCVHAPRQPDPQMAAPSLPAAAAGVQETQEPVEIPEAWHEPFSLGEYRLAIGDVVEVSVFGHRDTLAEEVPIAPDGRLYYMFGEGVEAAGRSPDEVAEEIEGRIGSLFVAPQVSIIPRRYVGARYSVLGQVESPGVYPLDASITIRQAVARAGGLAQGVYRGTTVELASLRNSSLIRDGQPLPIDFEALFLGNDFQFDLPLRPGDLVLIGSGLRYEVYLLGQVREQKSLAYHDGMTIVEVLAGASERGGGYLPNAHLEGAAILRGELDRADVIRVDIRRILEGKATDVYLAPGDIVYVPERPFRLLRDLHRTIVMSFATTFSGEAGADLMRREVFGEDQ